MNNRCILKTNFMPFTFNSAAYDFWDIYYTIADYYPMGMDGSSQPLLQSFRGTEKLNFIIQNKIHDPTSFGAWEAFDATVAMKSGYPVIGATYGTAPCYSSILRIETTTHGGLTRVKDLQYCVSLIGPFYTIFLTDRNEIKIADELVRSVNAHIVSPMGENENLFFLLEGLIEGHYPGYRFVPYAVYSQSMEGLAVRPDIEARDTIFHALFSYEVEFTGSILGDPYYPFHRWANPISVKAEDIGPA